MSRTICVVTGTRAEYGLLRWLMEGLRGDSALRLQIIVTGMHLSPEFGLTFREIERDGFQIDSKVEMLLSSDTPEGIAKSMGIGLMGIAESLSRLRPDLVVVLGDRFEMLSAASAALVARIPVAHLHGGESSEGAFDESIRHAITKMSHLHFVAAAEYRDRVIQLGEDPKRVFLVGGLGLDNIEKLQLLGRDELEASLDFRLGAKNLLITYHPVTLEGKASEQHMTELLAALDRAKDTNLIFTLPNADTGSRALAAMIERFVATHSNARCYTSLGQLRYLSCMRYVDGVVGNSSSGLIEAPAFRKGTINIGDRQKGRLKAKSVIDTAPNSDAITASLARLYSSEFQEVLRDVVNPYGQSGAADKILKTIRSYPLHGLLKKTFHDLEFTVTKVQ